MNQNYILIGAAIVAVIIGGVFLGQKLKKRNLPPGNMNQINPTSETGTTINSPIAGQPQVKVSTSKGDFTIELRPEVDNAAVVQLLGKISSGECDNRTVSECGLVDKSYVQVISGQLTPDAKISSIFILSK